ncbi:hypothetical protein STXM2123_82 [Streptomyces sp. F-3]|nr:hypothetical protein STXM2123_82 [Streptomyces sp. F-3]
MKRLQSGTARTAGRSATPGARHRWDSVARARREGAADLTS